MLQRYREVDALRGVAIVMMIVYHSLFDLSFFGIVPVDVLGGFWRGFAYATVSLFLLLVGISLTLSAARARIRSPAGWAFAARYVKRGAFILLLGLAITAVSWYFVPGYTILFGVLHLIGVSVMLSPLFLGRPVLSLVCGIACIPAGIAIAGVPGPSWLLWLGIHPAGFASLDYTPLLPWFGVVLTGIYIGSVTYPGGIRRNQFPLGGTPALSPLAFLGRHSLLIYLLHQPVILLLIRLLTGKGLL